MITGDPRSQSYGGVNVHVDYLSKSISKNKDIHLSILTFGDSNDEYEKNEIKYYVFKRFKTCGTLCYPFHLVFQRVL